MLTVTLRVSRAGLQPLVVEKRSPHSQELVAMIQHDATSVVGDLTINVAVGQGQEVVIRELSPEEASLAGY
jgi:hypothetical protein